MTHNRSYSTSDEFIRLKMLWAQWVLSFDIFNIVKGFYCYILLFVDRGFHQKRKVMVTQGIKSCQLLFLILAIVIIIMIDSVYMYQTMIKCVNYDNLSSKNIVNTNLYKFVFLRVRHCYNNYWLIWRPLPKHRYMGFILELVQYASQSFLLYFKRHSLCEANKRL